MSQSEKKSKFIQAWYQDECSNLGFGDKLKLARMWTEICLKDEEYEMAATIQGERDKIISKYKKEKKNNRKFSKKFKIWIYILERKFRK